MDPEPALPQSESIIPPPTPPARKFNPLLILTTVVLLIAVGTGGIFLGKSLNTSQPSTQPTVVPSPTQIPTLTSDITADWKTYSNTLAKFEIKYPAEWKEKTSPSSGLPVFYSAGEKEVLFYNFGPKGGMSMEDTIDNFCKGRHMKEIRRLFLDNFPAVYCQDPTLDPNRIFNQVLVQKDDFQIEINGDFAREDSENSLKIFDQILSTFKFLDQSQVDETANWKTYDSEILSFKYPANLTLQERQKNYFVLLSDPNNLQSVSISIDARLTGNYADYEKAVVSTKAGLIETQTQEMNNGLKISGKVGPGFGQGQAITITLFKYQQGAIEAETTATDPTQLQIYNQILSTFKFTSP